MIAFSPLRFFHFFREDSYGLNKYINGGWRIKSLRPRY